MTAKTEPKRTLIPVDIVRVDEPFATVYLADGSLITAKLVFVEVSRVMIDEQPGFDDAGKPAYHIEARIVIGNTKRKVNTNDK